MSSSIMAECFVCKAVIQYKSFDKHNLDKHNMLSWRRGEEPLDLNNEKKVLSILNKVLKSKKKKVLSCDLCNEEKKSALGFYTHKQVCGKTEEEVQRMRVTCDICGRSVMPVSVRAHMLAHERAQDQATENEQSTTQEDTLVESKTKRAAATKAKTRMSGAFVDKEMSPPKPSKRSKKFLSYTKLDCALLNPKPRLIEAWKNVIETQGGVLCPYKDCSFQASKVNDMQTHISACNGFSSHDMAFLCNWCLYQCKDESQVVMHIHSEHLHDDSDASCAESDSMSGEDLSSEDEKSPRRNLNRSKPQISQRSFTKLNFLNCSSGHNKDLDIYPAALSWTYEFRRANHKECVFPLLCTSENDWKFLQGIDAEQYLPTTQISVAIEVNAHKYKSTSRRYALFDSEVVDGVYTIFTGGPIWAMEWCPIPMRVSMLKTSPPAEYLAICTHHHMDDFHFSQTCYSSKNIIQLWECGSLDKDESQAPKFSLGLAHEFGTVWSLAWCPSGAYNSANENEINKHFRLRRLGLLSAACSDGAVRVFSIPFPHQLKNHLKDELPPIYRCSPTLTLIPNFAEQSQCIRVAWFQGKNHKLIAGGFSNGMIALWDLENLAPFLWDADKKILRPFHCFQAHLSVVTALSFCPEYDGRFLMTGSHDRTVKFWDLEDSSAPLSLHRRGLVTDGSWLGLWISSVTSYDDAFLLEHTNSTLHPVRDFGYKPFPLLVQNSVAWSLSYNEWINAVAQGSEAGEVVITFSNQLLQGFDNEKNMAARRVMISYSSMKKLCLGEDGIEKLGEVVTWKLNKTEKPAKNPKSRKKAQDEMDLSPNNFHVEKKPRTYEDTINMYGLSLHDIIKGRASKSQIPAEASSRVRLSGRMHAVSSDVYPITSINKVSWNPNLNKFFWLASGHHCGIVRITSVHFMQSQSVNKFLSEVSHRETKTDLNY